MFKSLMCVIALSCAASLSSAAIFLNAAPNPGRLVHDRMGEIQTVDYFPDNGNGSGTNSNSYFSSIPGLQQQGLDTQIDIDAGVYTENHSQHTHLRMNGNHVFNVETYSVFDYPEGEGEGEGEEGEPEPIFAGVQSSLRIDAYSFAGVYGGSGATAFDVRLSESGGNIGAPAYVNVRTDNPDASDTYRYFIIAPIGAEQLGEEVEVDLGVNWSTSTRYGGTASPNPPLNNVPNGSTTNGVFLESELSLDITLNGTPVDLGGYVPGDTNDLATTFTAHIGDVIGISYDLISKIGTNGVLTNLPPDVGLFANAHAQGQLAMNLSLPTTPSGSSPNDPVLPITPPTNPGDPFVLTGNLDPDGNGPGFEVPLWFDPIVAIEYLIELEGADIAEFYLPDLPDPDGFLVSFFDGSTWSTPVHYNPGEDEFLYGQGITKVLVSDIDESLMLDPLDPQAFAVGMIFENVTGLPGQPYAVQVTMTPTVIPEPTGAALLGGAGVLAIRRRRRLQVIRLQPARVRTR